MFCLFTFVFLNVCEFLQSEVAAVGFVEHLFEESFGVGIVFHLHKNVSFPSIEEVDEAFSGCSSS